MFLFLLSYITNVILKKMKLIVPPRKCFCHYLGIVRTLMNKKSRTFLKKIFDISQNLLRDDKLYFRIHTWVWTLYVEGSVNKSYLIPFWRKSQLPIEYRIRYIIFSLIFWLNFQNFSEIIKFLKRHWLILYFQQI